MFITPGLREDKISELEKQNAKLEEARDSYKEWYAKSQDYAGECEKKTAKLTKRLRGATTMLALCSQCIHGDCLQCTYAKEYRAALAATKGAK